MQNSAVTKSRVLKTLIYLLWAAPAGYIVGLAALYNLPLPKALSILFSFYYIARSVLHVYTGLILYQSKPWAWHIYILNSLLMIIEQLYFGLVLAETHLVFPSVTVAIVAILLGIFLVKIEFRVPYFSPQIAWWESDPRYRISVPVHITAKEHFHTGEIMDISASGCFIKIKNNFTIEDTISLRFSIFEKEYFCKGRVVWNTESALTHPKGIGVRFLDIDKEDYVYLKETVKKLRGISKQFRRDRREEKVTSIQQKLKNNLEK